MTDASTTLSAEALVARQKADHGFEQALYRDEAVYALERERLFSGRWLFVDHDSLIPEPGDYFVREFLGESILFVRGRDNEPRAFYNVCRHRGSRICDAQRGNTKTLVCPYHAWSYNLDGSLRRAPHMPEDFDPQAYGLVQCDLRTRHGLMFIRLGPERRDDFAEMMAPFEQVLDFYGSGSARVAAREVLPVRANWKLVIENNQECYHCQIGHPEFFATMSSEYVLAFGAGPDSGPPDAMREFEQRIATFEQKAQSLGHLTGSYVDPADSAYFRAWSRVPYRDGFVSLTEDGQPVAPLMGHAKDFDGGRTAITFDPFTIMIGSVDYACIINMMPKGPLETDTILTWLVDADAEEGRDYDLERLKWLFDVTIRQDGVLAERNQLGVDSEAYRPGMYSLHEAAAVRFHDWYLAQMRQQAPRLAKTS